jgi:hypothetical protein
MIFYIDYTTKMIQLAAPLCSPCTPLFSKGGIRLPLFDKGSGQAQQRTQGKENARIGLYGRNGVA